MHEDEALQGTMSNSSGSKRSRYGSEYGGGLNRNPVKQAKRHQDCLKLYEEFVVTGTEETILHKLRAAHIVSLSQLDGIGSKFAYSTANAILLEPLIEEAFDRHEWYFDEKGDIVVLWDKCAFKEILETKQKLLLPPEAREDLVHV